MSTISFLASIPLGLVLSSLPNATVPVQEDANSALRHTNTVILQASYFTYREFVSKGDGSLELDPRLIPALNATRHAIGRPIQITSGYRDPTYNQRIGGARRSRHLIGDAVDINIGGYSSYARYKLVWHLIRNGFTSFGTYGGRPNMLHADMRPYAAIWHHGAGNHPAWLLRALRDWRWRTGTGSPLR